MRTVRQFALLVGTLLPLPPLLFPQGVDPTGIGSKDSSPNSVQRKNGGANPPVSDSLDVFRRTAQTKAARAAALRRKQTSPDFATAIGLFRASAQLFQAGHLYEQAADAYLQMGEIYFTLSKYDKALGSYRRARRLAGSDRDQHCRVLSHIARAYATTGHTSEANAYSSQALSLCEGLPNRKTRAEVLEARGEALYNSGDSVKSEELFRRAQDLFAEVGDDDGQAQARLMLGYCRFRVGERAEAIRLAGRAMTLWDSSGNRHGVAEAHAALALFAMAVGEFETAECNYGRAGVFHEINDKDNEAIVLNGLGYVKRVTGDAQASLEYYRQAKAAFASVPDRLGVVEAITGMGMALVALHRYHQLLPLYAEKLHLAKQANNPILVASALADLAGVRELNHQYLKAETLYRRSLVAYHSAHHPLREVQVSIRLGHLQAGQAKYPQAIALLENALTLAEQTGQVEDIARAQYELAFIYRRLGRLEDALQAIQRTIDIIESQRLKMSPFDSRASYFASVHKYYALYIQILMLLDRQDAQLRNAVKAFEASEKSKVRSLLDWLAGSSQDAPCNELLKRQLEIADSGANQPTDSNQKPVAEVAPALTLDQVRTEIADDDAILLEYALGDEKSYVWVVNREQMSSYELPGATSLNALVRGFRNAATAQQRRQENNKQYLYRLGRAERAYPKYADELSRVLLGMVPFGQAKRIIIVPDGPLQYVPFAALSVPTENGSSAPVRADHEVVILPSASALGAIRKAAESRPRPTLPAAVFADPVFERGDPRVTGHFTTRTKQLERSSPARDAIRGVTGSRYIPLLPGSGKEADAVQDSLGSDVFVARGFLASRETVLNHDLGRYRIVVFATHGVLDEKHPERSGLILSLFNKQGEERDGYLTLNDIYGLKLSADLVVLSSCDSGLGQDLSSEGIIGLPRAFLRAGAKSVIATLWKVDDEATAQLMKHFYSRMHKGESPASALRHAQIELSKDERWSRPYYWAAFVFQGDYRLSGLN